MILFLAEKNMAEINQEIDDIKIYDQIIENLRDDILIEELIQNIENSRNILIEILHSEDMDNFSKSLFCLILSIDVAKAVKATKRHF